MSECNPLYIAVLTVIYRGFYCFRELHGENFKGLRNDIAGINIETCAERDGDYRYSTVDVKGLSVRLKYYAIHNRISDVPTSYLCNDNETFSIK